MLMLGFELLKSSTLLSKLLGLCFYGFIILQVNEGVREKENSDRLEWLQSYVSLEGLKERLVFNSLTNSVGPRKLLHFGTLTKVSTDFRN